MPTIRPIYCRCLSGAITVVAFALGGCGGGDDATTSSGPTRESFPQAQLAAQFQAATSAIFEAKTPEALAAIKAGNECTVTPGERGLVVTATGDDPSLRLPDFIAGKRAILEVVIQSPAATGIQLFYLRGGATTYTEASSQLYPLKKGRNVVYFRLDYPDVVDPLRLDPGYTAGEYVIESIVAREIAAAPGT